MERYFNYFTTINYYLMFVTMNKPREIDLTTCNICPALMQLPYFTLKTLAAYSNNETLKINVIEGCSGYFDCSYQNLLKILFSNSSYHIEALATFENYYTTLDGRYKSNVANATDINGMMINLVMWLENYYAEQNKKKLSTDSDIHTRYNNVIKQLPNPTAIIKKIKDVIDGMILITSNVSSVISNKIKTIVESKDPGELKNKLLPLGISYDGGRKKASIENIIKMYILLNRNTIADYVENICKDSFKPSDINYSFVSGTSAGAAIIAAHITHNYGGSQGYVKITQLYTNKYNENSRITLDEVTKKIYKEYHEIFEKYEDKNKIPPGVVVDKRLQSDFINDDNFWKLCETTSNNSKNVNLQLMDSDIKKLITMHDDIEKVYKKRIINLAKHHRCPVYLLYLTKDNYEKHKNYIMENK